MSAKESPIEEDLLPFSFPINIQHVLLHLKQDLRDDWFFDTLGYTDLLSNKNELRRVISDILHHGNGQYLSGNKSIHDIPKSSLGLRYSVETDFYDRFIYQAICTYLIKFFDPQISNRVLSHRFEPHPIKTKYLFKHRITLWQNFEGITKAGLKKQGALLVTDLLNYYENITVKQVISSLVEKIPFLDADGHEKLSIRNAITSLESLLKKWCYTESFGLPQNRDTSSFLSNVVLTQVDKAMIEKGYDYYRYVDDIRIVCKDKNLAKRALSDLIQELRKLNLNINSSKTIILTKSSSDEDINSCFPTFDDRTSVIDNMWKSRSKRVITRSIPVLNALISELIKHNKTQSRQFRFCINRLRSIAEAGIFDYQQLITPNLTKALIQQLAEQPASTDQFCKIVAGLTPDHEIFQRVEDFLKNTEISINSWQNYCLWMSLAGAAYKSDSLAEFAKSKILSHTHDAEIPAIFIYIARINKEELLEPLIEQFNADWPYKHQRHFLIASQGLSNETLRPLRTKLSPRLELTVKRIRENTKITDKTYHQPKFGDVTEIYDNINPYD